MTMLCGSSDRFAVKWEVCRRFEDQIFGKFALVIVGEEVGDYYDDGTYMIGCYHGIKEFMEIQKSRFEPGLFEMDKVLAYRNLVNPIYAENFGSEPMVEVYKNTYGRFHVGYLGMTALDEYVLLLVQSQTGESRFIWKKWDGDIQEAYVATGEVEAVFSEFLSVFRAESNA